MAVALHENMGIGALPALTVLSAFRAGTLVRVLPKYQLQRLNIFAVYPSRQFLDAKIKTWIEFLKEWIWATLATDDAELRGVSPSE
jgi:DNA-binding transcriptional LysR family regulator